MANSKRVFRSVLSDFKASALSLATFSILSKFVVASLSIPAVALFLRSLVSMPVRSKSGSWEFFEYSGSFPGVVLVMIVVFFWLVGFLVEQSGLLLIASVKVRGGVPKIREVLLKFLRTAPRIVGLSSFQAGVYTLCFVPLLAVFAFVTRNIIDSGNGRYPSFFTGFFGWLLAAASLLVLVRLMLSWLFAMHFGLLCREKFLKALGSSKKLVKGNRMRLAHILGRFWLLTVVILLVFSLAFRGGRELMVSYSREPTSFNIFRLSLFASAETVFITVFWIVVAGLFSILVTRLFLELVAENNLEALEEAGTYLSKEPKIQKRPWILLLLGLFAFQATYFDYYGKLLVESEVDLPLVTAHRGSSLKAPENTMSAIIQAVHDGADIIEIDVQLTSDGHVVLNHDRTLSKVAGVSKSVPEMTLEEIKAIDVGRRFSRNFAGERIATLEEVIEYMNEVDTKIKLNIELKDYEKTPMIVQAVLDTLEKHEFTERIVITSTSRDRLAAVRESDPAIRIGLIVTYITRDLWSLDVDFYSVSSTILNGAFMIRARSYGRDVHVWTVNDTESMMRYTSMGVSSIITDRPETLSQLLIRKAQLSIFQRRVLAVLSF
ncbi:MAG: glycerophosphodiester phosphodiesterase family protein [Thermotogota bacterium]|nr:glycerophosphodiester phosphodiesterase family protein [Thermotogota bacterium]